jgi:hypothetical protein
MEKIFRLPTVDAEHPSGQAPLSSACLGQLRIKQESGLREPPLIEEDGRAAFGPQHPQGKSRVFTRITARKSHLHKDRGLVYPPESSYIAKKG